MPVINEDYINESINSICNQSYENWELFILACGPLKKTQEIISKFNDPRIEFIQLDTSIGMLKAFNVGLKKSRGEYIIRHDPDDISLPKRLELQVNYLKAHKELGMVSCCIKAFTKDYRFKNQCKNINMVQNFYRTKEDIDSAVLRGNYPIIFPSLMIRKVLFNDIDILNKKAIFEDEVELALNLLKESGIEKIDSILYYYRRHYNAYHSINNIEYKKNLRASLADMELMNSIKYREFHNELVTLKVDKINASKSSIFHVLMLVDELNIGGTETYVFNIAKALIGMGVSVIIGSLGGVSEELFKLHKISTTRISMNMKLKAIEEIKYLIDTEGINLLHCHLNKSMELGKEIYRRYNIRYIVTLHGMFYSKEVLLSTCLEAKAIIAVSNPVRDLFIKNIEAKFQGILTVIPNGIDTEAFKPDLCHTAIREKLGISQNSLVITYCSRLGWGKGALAEVVLSSFKKISLKNRDIHFIIIGDGDKKDNIIRMAEELNLSLNRKLIHVVGARYDVLSYYLESDFIIGTARVTLEALSCEKAVIAVGSKGCVGIVSKENKEEMWDLYFGDHEGKEDTNNISLENSIEYLIDSPEKRLELGEWGRKWCIEKFEIVIIANEIVDIYTEIFKG